MPRRSAFGNVVSENPLTTLVVAAILGLAVYFLFFNKSGFTRILVPQNNTSEQMISLEDIAEKINNSPIDKKDAVSAELLSGDNPIVYEWYMNKALENTYSGKR
jgi:hypothetical protein